MQTSIKEQLVLLSSSADDTIITHLSGILEDKSTSLEEIEELAIPFVIELKLAKDEAEAKSVIAQLLGAGTRSTTDYDVKKLVSPVILNEMALEVQASKRVDMGNTFDAVLSLEPDVDVPKKCVSIEEFMTLTFSMDPLVRRKALRELCPCHVKKDVEQFWDRIVEMISDPDERVRYQVLHNLCDGSPKTREEKIIAAIEELHNDPDKTIRSTVHRVLTSYRHTGKWNIL